MHYNKVTLEEYCKINSIMITNELHSNINREVRLEGKCLTCNNKFNKTFRSIIKFGAYCKECSMKLCVIKRETTCLKRIGVKNPNQSKEIMEKRKNTNIERYGFPNASQNKDVIEKLKKTQREIFDNSVKKELIIQKRQTTTMERYDKENPSQVELFKEKIKVTSNKRYGFENPMKSPLVKAIQKESIYKLHGGYTYDVPHLMDKVNKTMIEKYNVKNAMHCEYLKNKMKETNIERYNSPYPMQNKCIMEKSFKASFKMKTYILPSGKVIEYQGYENFALDELLKIYHEDEIVNGAQNVPELWYITNDKKHRHYVDFYIPKKNKCIEIKSTFTLNNKKDNVFDKQKYAKEEGYLYEIWVYDKGIRIEMY
jgi:hypothetical protein